MRNKKIFILVAVLLVLLLAVQASAEVKKIKSIGEYTFVRVRGKIPTPEVMKMLADRYAGDIKYGFDQAGYGDIYLAFIDQLKSAQFEDTTWNTGETVQWMLFRSHGKIKVTGELEWAGKKPVEVFAVKVEVGFKTYTFIIPKPCGNIALKGVVEVIPEAICALKVSPVKANINDPITVDMSGSQYVKSLRVEVYDKQGNKVASKDLTPEAAKWQTKLEKPGEYIFKGVAINFADKASTNPCEGKVYINYPPVSKVVPNCLNCLEYVGRPLTFDASGSSDPDGEVTKVAFELTDANGQVVDSFVDSEKPFTWQKTLYKEGNYTVSVTSYDNNGAVSASTEDSRKTMKVTRKTLFVMAEVGPMLAHGSYTGFVFARTGMYLWLKPDKTSLAFTSGAAMPTRGAPWKALITANVIGNVHFGNFFTGLGVGLMTKERTGRKDGIDAVGQIGYTLSNDYLTMWQLYFEFRVPLGRSFTDCHKMAVGLRYNF
jgi:flagellar hook assembly protein FlgD